MVVNVFMIILQSTLIVKILSKQITIKLKKQNSFRNLIVLATSKKLVFSGISSIKRSSDKLSNQIFSENKISENELKYCIKSWQYN